MPHFLARSDTIELETRQDDLAKALQAYGHEVKVGDMNSGMTAILFHNDMMIGAADPRREGIAAGY